MKQPSDQWAFVPWPSFNVLLGIIFIVGLLILDFSKRRKTWSRYPPGPPSFPFVGNLMQVDLANLHISYKQLVAQHGDVFSLQFFWQNIVVLNGYDVMKEALIQKSDDIADRPSFEVYEAVGFKGNSKGVVMAHYGRAWKEQRRFSLSTMRDFGMGKKSLEERVTEEASYLCSVFKAKQGRPFNPRYIVNTAVSNLICSIIFGDRFEYDDHKFQQLLHFLEGALNAESSFLAQVANAVPWLTRIPGFGQKVFKPQIDILKFLEEIIHEHQQTWDPGYIRDFVDAFMVEMEKVNGDEDTSFNKKSLLNTTFDLFTAGTETTTTTLRWALLLMLLYPDVQRKVHEEIDQVIGRHRKPTMGDVLEMSYTNAVIHEIQRFGDIIPLAIAHKTYRDTEIHGYFIPKMMQCVINTLHHFFYTTTSVGLQKGIVIITNLSSVLKDERFWEKPLQFYPEHFLDNKGKFVRREAFLPFSAGRRACLGEQLARMELFLVFTTLMQHFTFSIPDGQPPPREDAVVSVTLSPHPYEICANIR